MKRRAVKQLISSACAVGIMLGAACLASGAADAANGISLVVNPYEGIDWDHAEQFKMNVHTHTTESDGAMPPRQVIDEYHARGYDALVITDHNRCTWPWSAHDREPSQVGMLAIPGNELSRHHHTLSLFTEYESPETDHDIVLTGLAEAGGVGILCHPAMHWLRDYSSPSSLSVALAPELRAITEGDFCAETWFRTTDPGRNIPLGNFSPAYTGALNLELHTGNRVRLFLQPAKGGNTVDINVAADELGINTRDGKWHHLAGLRRGGEMFLYLDGRLAAKRADTAGSFPLQGGALFIGRDGRTSDTVFKGDLAGIRFWRRAPAEDEIAAAAAGKAISSGDLLAHYLYPGTPDGPFPAVPAGANPPVAVSDGPEALGGTGALRFGANEFPTRVADEAVVNFAALFQRHPCLAAIEVVNRTRPNREYPLDRELWDSLLSVLMPERPLWGAAVDDMHGMQHLGFNWFVVPAPNLDVETVRSALTGGAYYFSSIQLLPPESADVARTPQITRIVHDEDAHELRVLATEAGEPLPDDAYVWISAGRTIQKGPVLAYQDAAGVGAYARVEISGSGGITYTNPFGFRH